MNRMQKLIQEWEEASKAEPTVKVVPIQLSSFDYARVRALAEIFPARPEAQILSELVTAALDEIEEAFPYIQGKQVIARDEFDDPIYSDEGLTHKFEILTKRYVAATE